VSPPKIYFPERVLPLFRPRVVDSFLFRGVTFWKSLFLSYSVGTVFWLLLFFLVFSPPSLKLPGLDMSSRRIFCPAPVFLDAEGPL